MQLTICRLTPELAQDYVHFFDTTPHDDGIPEHRCYCVCWASESCHGVDFSTAEKRRAAALDYISRGVLQGYLAYADGQPVGWCNANTKADCLHCGSWEYFMQDVPVTQEHIKSVFCFTIAPHVQRQGVASALLQRVIHDAKAEGFAAVEAYPRCSEAGFSGPLSMYERAGFAITHTLENKLIVKKSL